MNRRLAIRSFHSWRLRVRAIPWRIPPAALNANARMSNPKNQNGLTSNARIHGISQLGAA